MSGMLTIHSSGDGHLLSGHSWIEYKKDGDVESSTYGTWGNNPTGNGNGLFKDLEKGRIGDEHRETMIDDKQEEILFKKIKEYEDKGPDGWKYLNPCSGFASDTWNSVTGEKLQDRNWGISNPSTLKASIKNENKKIIPVPKKVNIKQWSSGKKLKSPVLPCSQ